MRVRIHLLTRQAPRLVFVLVAFLLWQQRLDSIRFLSVSNYTDSISFDYTSISSWYSNYTNTSTSRNTAQEQQDDDNNYDGLVPRPLWKDANASTFCLTWEDEFDIDAWWTHNYEWEEDVRASNVTHSCFHRIQDAHRLDFLRKVYHVQWHGNCSLLKQKYIINSGYGASFGVILKAFLSTMLRGNFSVPFQMTRHWDGAVWLYSTKDNSSWAYCESHDMACYLLPLSNCPAQYRESATDTRPNYREDGFPRVFHFNRRRETAWLRRYMNRYKKSVRKQVVHTLHAQYPRVQLPCTAMHVRRGDSGLPRVPYRRYAAVSEYLQVGQVKPGDNIVLLT